MTVILLIKKGAFIYQSLGFASFITPIKLLVEAKQVEKTSGTVYEFYLNDGSILLQVHEGDMVYVQAKIGE